MVQNLLSTKSTIKGAKLPWINATSRSGFLRLRQLRMECQVSETRVSDLRQ